MLLSCIICKVFKKDVQARACHLYISVPHASKDAMLLPDVPTAYGRNGMDSSIRPSPFVV